MKYLITLTAATILLTPSCLEQKVKDYSVPPQLESDAKGMVITSEQSDLEPVISSQIEDELKLLFYNLTPVHENYY